MPLSEPDKFGQFCNQRQVTILITDSGLGGISICAEIAAELMRRHMFEKVSLIYFNAWPEQNRGYNRLSNTAERIQVFDSALEGMMKFKPDFILIACNTLSVLYHYTQFSQHVRIPVVDIVGFGVEMMANALKTSAQDQAVILGTVTTVESHVHRDNLIQNGIQPGQIVSQSCDQLATEIEKGPDSTIVSEMIQTFMRQAARNIDPDSGNIYAALCCTHFGYCQELIQSSLTDFTKKPVTILNPNHRMAAFVWARCREIRFSHTTVEIQVVSKITWGERKIKSISSLIQSVSVETAHALINYAHIPNLFG
jgi:glutamate racemase